MLLSRGAPLLRQLASKSSHRAANPNVGSVRNSGWAYRSKPPVNPQLELHANIAGGFAWWWMFYHIITEPEHIYGEFPYPDPTQWTDEELGVPPDDYEPERP